MVLLQLCGRGVHHPFPEPILPAPGLLQGPDWAADCAATLAVRRERCAGTPRCPSAAAWVGRARQLQTLRRGCAGNVFAVAADHLAAHKVILLATYGVTAALRFSLSTVQSFGLMLAMVVLMEVASAPVNILVDASVMSAGGVRALPHPRRPCAASSVGQPA